MISGSNLNKFNLMIGFGVYTIFDNMSSSVITGALLTIYLRYPESTILRSDTGTFYYGIIDKNILKISSIFS